MENLLGEKPYMTPISTISSTGAETQKAANTSLSISSEAVANTNFCSTSDDQSFNSNIRVSRKSAYICIIIEIKNYF